MIHVGLFEYIIFKIIKILIFAKSFNKYLQLSGGIYEKKLRHIRRLEKLGRK